MPEFILNILGFFPLRRVPTLEVNHQDKKGSNRDAEHQLKYTLSYCVKIVSTFVKATCPSWVYCHSSRFAAGGFPLLIAAPASHLLVGHTFCLCQSVAVASLGPVSFLFTSPVPRS